MKSIGFFCGLIFCSLLWAESKPTSITIGFTPGGDAEVLKKGSAQIAESLQKELGSTVKVYLSPDYSGLLQAFKEKKIDFAFLTARTFVEAEQDFGVKVLLKKVWHEQPYYYSVILVRKKSNIKNIEGLRHKTIAFVDKKSTSGYLYPQVMLKKKNMKTEDFKEVHFSGSHSASVELMEKNEVDAIAVFSDDSKGLRSAWIKYSKQSSAANDYRVLWVSEPIPNDPFCVRKDFYEQYPKFTHSLMFTLIDAVESLKSKKEVTDLLGANGFLPATSRQYDTVREMVTLLGPTKD